MSKQFKTHSSINRSFSQRSKKVSLQFCLESFKSPSFGGIVQQCSFGTIISLSLRHNVPIVSLHVFCVFLNPHKPHFPVTRVSTNMDSVLSQIFNFSWMISAYYAHLLLSAASQNGRRFASNFACSFDSPLFNFPLSNNMARRYEWCLSCVGSGTTVQFLFTSRGHNCIMCYRQTANSELTHEKANCEGRGTVVRCFKP